MTAAPILVTGSHRSGSTWLGEMLSLAPGIVYVHEPLRVGPASGRFGAATDRWFVYIDSENEEKYKTSFSKTLALEFDYRAEFFATLMNPRRIRASPGEAIRFAKGRRNNARVLIKDPIAVFSSGWMSHTFGVQVVATVRHPCAFAYSLTRQNWTHPFEDFTEQPRLMQELPDHLREEIQRFASSPPDLLDQAALLWKLIYGWLADRRSLEPTWIYVRHEDLANNPALQLATLYEQLGLEFTKVVEDKIMAHTRSQGPAKDISQYSNNATRRDSKQAASAWRKKLTQRQVERVQEKVWGTFTKYYAPHEW